ncbi:MAG: cation:proton antiporter [Rhodospirillaceae bacterium]|jgi:Kef-type K+ transport system membrane component KefB|nr:cation:proton antiporter [Rhodospirillaceae bacterium]
MLTNTELTQFLISTVTLLIMAHSVGYAFERLRLPRVVGEICGGLLVGPSVLGLLAPGATAWLVPDQLLNGKLLSAVYWLGLMLLMFTAGFKVQQNFDAQDRRFAGLLLLGATVIPFSAGWAATYWIDLGDYIGPRGNGLTLALIFAIAVAVTSIPVISRIFMDLGILETRFAKIVLAASTVQDVLLWAALAVATSLAATQSPSLMDAGIAAGRTLLFTALALLLGPPLLRYANRLRINLVLKASRLGYTLVWCLLMVSLAAALEVNVVFGAFIAGIVLGSLPPSEFEDAKAQISSFGLGFFIPIYFAIVGFRIDLPGAFDGPLFFGFLIFSTVIEGICVYVTMRLSRCGKLTSWHFAVAMNTRGGPGIVLASVAYDFGLIDERFFVTLVLAAIVTSLAAGAWFRHAVAKGLPLLDQKS